MKKDKQLLIIIFILAIFFGQAFSSSKVFAETTTNTTRLNWSNPQKGSNPFKFTAQDFVNPQMMMSVVGCTGVVDKVTGAITNLVQTVIDNLILKEATEAQLEKFCQGGETAVGTATASIINTTLSAPVLKEMCRTIMTQKTKDKKLAAEQKETNKILTKQQKFDQCLSGIAITLAKNQLVAMTKSTMNWVTTGFNGDPMYIQNIDNFMSNLSNKITNKELDMFKDSYGNYNTTDYPYARNIARSIVYSNDTQNDQAGAMKQDLTSYLSPGATIQNFSNDFSQGGWSGWMALTQHPQNNPLGFETQVAQDLAKKKEQKKQDTINETKQNGGYLSQKVCDWNALTKKGGEGALAKNQAALAEAQKAIDQAAKGLMLAKSKLDMSPNDPLYQSDVEKANTAVKNAKANYKQLLSEIQNASGNAQKQNPEDCPSWKVVTPGSTIKDKVSTYINSPERQLELAKTINDSLYTLFGALINKFRLNGLSSLGSDSSSFNKVSGGFGSNSLTTSGTVDNEGNPVPNSGGYASDNNFDLTRDLGNQYYHVSMNNLGNWNAETNTPYLSKGVGPYSAIAKEYLSDVYYVVIKAGNTEIVPNAPNSWAVGDRAYFDGTNWQDWKKGTPNPIKKRGVIQVQEDFIAASNLLLQHLPGVMPKIGELDYCIPGPNPSWQANSSNVSSAFMDFVNALKTNYLHGGFLKRNYVTIDSPSGKIYNTYKNLFKGTGLWEEVAKTAPYKDISYLSSSAPTKRQTGKWKGNSKIGEANNRVQELQSNIIKSYETFTKNYSKIVDKLYGKDSLMQKTYLQKESTPAFLDNSDYLPMAPAGDEITANAISYNQQITNEAASYKEAINQAELNIYQLQTIAKRVKKIVKDAQDARAIKLAKLKQTNSNIKVKAGEDIKKGDKLYTTGSDDQGNPIVMKYSKSGTAWIGTANKNISSGDFGRMTKSSTTGWTIPVACLTEEQLDYIDNADMVTDMGGTKEQRCSDGIDNDLDGLIDAQDPDCKGQIPDNGPDSMLLPGRCLIDPDSSSYSGSNSGSDEIIVPSVHVNASPFSLVSGDSSTISWTSENARSCTLSGGGLTGSGISNNGISTGPLTKTTLYSVSCEGDNGAGSGVAIAVVKNSNVAVPSVSVNASPSSIVPGGSSTISWTSENAKSCTLSGGGLTGYGLVNNGVSTGALTRSMSYSVSCEGDNGTASGTVIVDVNSNANSSSYENTDSTCSSRKTKNLCLGSTATDSKGQSIECMWKDDPIGGGSGSGSFGGSGDFGSNGDFGGYKPPNDYLSEKL